MNITAVSVRKIDKEESRMKGVASVTLDDSFVIHDIKIIDGQDGLFIAMPSRRLPSGDFKDIAHPIKSETRAQFQDAILEEFNNIE